MNKFDPSEFVKKQIKEIKGILSNERVLIAVSGGVDSTTCAVLTHLAIGKNLLCVMLDDAFMREAEPERVSQHLSNPPLNLPIKIINVQEQFLKALEGVSDAEEKRKAFREAFYTALSETAEKEGCKYLVQGTIRADIVETEGGIKTQHNILSQIGIKPIERYNFQVIEPISTLYKPQVRQVARYLKVPQEMSERQPFPGPGLSVRVVGEIKSDKLESLKKATVKVEEKLAKHQPEQYFAAIVEDLERPRGFNKEAIQESVAKFLNVQPKKVSVRILKDRATGIKEGVRHYGNIGVIKVLKNDKVSEIEIKKLVALQSKIVAENPSLTRILYTIKEIIPGRPYIIAIRAINTDDFMTAQVAEIPWSTLKETAREITKVCSNISSVVYDVTPKPPATIEME